MDKFIIAQYTPGPLPDRKTLRDVDNADIFKRLIMFGLEPVFSEGDDSYITVWFDAKEVERVENMYLSKKDILVPLQRVFYADELWNDLFLLWKSKKRHILAQST